MELFSGQVANRRTVSEILRGKLSKETLHLIEFKCGMPFGGCPLEFTAAVLWDASQIL